MTETHYSLRALLRQSSVVMALCAAAMLTAACSDSEVTSPVSDAPTKEVRISATDAISTAIGEPQLSVVLAGAGSLGRCNDSNSEATAKLLDQTSGTIFTTGDNAYPNGSSSDFSNCYHPNWGRHRARTRPSAGDQDYKTSGAAGYFGYFGSTAGERGKGYYSYTHGAWQVVVLNDNLPITAASTQLTWLREELKKNPNVCTVAYWHRPLFSSYGTSVRSEIKPIWDALYEAGVDVVINGHYRVYERFARQNPDGGADAQHGIRQFTVGTGGSGTDAFRTSIANSEARGGRVYGVLKLTLNNEDYSWEFIPIAGESYRDSGSASCHRAPGSPTLSSVNVAPASASVITGQSAQLSATALDQDGNILANQPLTWVSEDTSKVKVSAVGIATGFALGTAYVIATSGGMSDTSTVTVIPVPVASVNVTPSTSALIVGGAVQLSAATLDAEGSMLTGRSVSWSSSNAAVATVTSTGAVQAVAAGNAVITATSEGNTDAAAITVSAPVVTTTGGIRPGHYAAPDGSSSNSGSYDRPWTLAYALAGGGGRVQPGDTIWMRGGTYRGAFRSTVVGTASRPVVVRQYPGERAIIDGAGTSSGTSVFYVGGSHTVFWGFEITNTNTVRTTSSTTNNVRPNVVSNYASNTKYVNLVVHDGGVAFYNDANASNVEVTGCIFYNNGWQGPDRGHGHALYIKSINGPVLARDNIMFNQYGYGVHAYTNAGSGKLNNIRFEGNVAFNNGTMSSNSTSSNILLGGSDTATGDELVDNFAYYSPGISGTNVKVGYSTTRNGSVVVRGNYMVGGSTVLELGYWSSATISSNILAGASTMVRVQDGTASGKIWGSNDHHRSPTSTSWRFGSGSYTFTNWVSTSQLGGSDRALSSAPTATRVFVRANPHEQGRANVIVYNWGGQGSVAADLSAAVPVGARYEVRNVQDLYSSPVASGTYAGGSIMIPITSVAPPAPVGMASRSPRTGPDFDVFVVTIR